VGVSDDVFGMVDAGVGGVEGIRACGGIPSWDGKELEGGGGGGEKGGEDMSVTLA